MASDTPIRTRGRWVLSAPCNLGGPRQHAAAVRLLTELTAPEIHQLAELLHTHLPAAKDWLEERGYPRGTVGRIRARWEPVPHGTDTRPPPAAAGV